MRNFTDVVNGILTLIPQTEEVLINEIKEVLDSVEDVGSKLYGEWWNKLGFILLERIPTPFTQLWQVKVIAHFTNRSEEHVCSLYAIPTLRPKLYSEIMASRN